MSIRKRPQVSISGNTNDPHRYDDMLLLPPHKSTKHPAMSMENRAAQFSPFAALTGYEAVIEETARLTYARQELTEEVRQEVNRRLLLLKDQERSHPTISITYFLPDQHKEGGSYHTEQVSIKKIDNYRRALILTDFREIPFGDIIEIGES